MARIVHIALRVDDLDRASEFYKKVFSFAPIKTASLRDTVRHLTDGTINLAINKRDGKESSDPDSPSKGSIDHFGIEVEDVDRYVAEIRKFGCEIIDDPPRPLKFRAPGGILVEIVSTGSKAGVRFE